MCRRASGRREGRWGGGVMGDWMELLLLFGTQRSFVPHAQCVKPRSVLILYPDRREIRHHPARSFLSNPCCCFFRFWRDLFLPLPRLKTLTVNTTCISSFNQSVRVIRPLILFGKHSQETRACRVARLFKRILPEVPPYRMKHCCCRGGERHINYVLHGPPAHRPTTQHATPPSWHT